MLRRALAGSLLAYMLLFGCHPAQASLPTARHAAAPKAELPVDLDVAVRVNVKLLASELGNPLAQRLLFEAVTAPDEQPPSALLAQALAETELLWLGWRSGNSPDIAQKVLILRGQFSNLSPDQGSPATRWEASTSGVGWPHFVRRAPAGALERLYPRGPELLFWATAREAPSLERMFEQGGDASSLRAPERGAVSAAARPEWLRPYLERYPQLAEHFAGVELLQAYADPSATELALDVELRFGTPARALDASDVVEKLRQKLAHQPCALGVLAEMSGVSVFERSLRVQARLLPEQVAGLKACVLAGKCCD